MKIILGKNAGFCYGVKNAVNGAKNAVKNNEIVLTDSLKASIIQEKSVNMDILNIYLLLDLNRY